MLYSPLYQSIRMILFGALSLTGLTVSAATIDDDNLNAAALVADSPTIVDTQAEFNNTSYTDSTYYSESVAPRVLADDNHLVTNDSSIANSQSVDDEDYVNQAITITPITDNSDDITASNTAGFDEQYPTEDNDSNDTIAKEAVAEDSIDQQQAADGKRLKAEDESIQQSLVRLAEFYELRPDTDVSELRSKNDKNIAIDAQDSLQKDPQTIQKLGNNLNLVPRTVDSSQRCEGQWVYPTRNPNYQRAVDEANATNDQMTERLKTTNAQAALFAEADYGYYDNIDYAELSGNVIVDQGNQHIEADKVLINRATGVAGAQGNVMFTDQAVGNGQSRATADKRGAEDEMSSTEAVSQGGLIGVADSLAYNTESGQATAHGVAYASVPMQSHGYAKRLNRPNESQYELDEVMFTTCPPTDRKWQLEAKSIDLNTDTGRGEARNTTFRIADVPVFYLPYFNFPIDERRSSGFLVPSASIGSESGLEVDVPYYLNLAPNYDATLNTRIYTSRNPMISGEFRYLTEEYGGGILNGSYLPNDKEYNDEDRSSLFYDHYWSSNSIPRLSGDAKYSYVSDADYLNDFDTLGLSSNTVNLPRRARLNYYNDYVTGELKVETFQTLDAFTNTGEALQDKDKPYSRLPQLSLNYRLPWLNSFDITGTHDSAYFKKSIDDGSENEKSGVRVYNKLSASYPLEKPWGYIKPKVSLQHLYTSYDEDSLEDNLLSKEDGSQSVFVPQASIDAGLNLYQAGSPFGAFDNSLGGYQLLSPRLKYTYSPYEDQNDIPNFNTRIASINYEQLFSDSWFLGKDRLQDLHAFTAGLNYSYIDATGVTRFDGNIAEQYYIDDGRVTLEDQTPVFSDSSSGLVWDASAQPYNNVWVDVSGAFTNSYDLNYITTELRYQPTDNSLFNVGFVKRQRDRNTNQLPLSALTASTIFPISNNWRILAQGQYDHRRNKMLDALVGVDYEDCCFGFAVYGRRYYNDLNIQDEPTQAIMAEIRLNGLGGGSGRLTRLLSEKVLGFEPVQSAWKD
ncbi:LPS-assembly protein LptD [Psychrobacter jeotgali]|uniref:LPS-assembly protein LptD n=1 Tax=Psychrobacter jeotgali TaxID=179010 RepID=UPI0019197082